MLGLEMFKGLIPKCVLVGYFFSNDVTSFEYTETSSFTRLVIILYRSRPL